MKELISVIGGGISGLAFSHYCTLNHYPVRVFDKQRSGGCISSYASDPYCPVDMGAHTLTNTYQHIIEIIKHYSAQDLILPKERLKFNKYQDRLVPVTRGLQRLELAGHLLSLPFSKKSGKSIKQYYSGILGKRNYRELFRYAFQAILCQNPDDYPAELLFRKRTRNKAYPRNFTLKGGVEKLLELMAANPLIHPEPVSSISKLTSADGLFHLWQNDGAVYRSPFICLACPPDSAAMIINDLDPVLAGKLAEIRMVTVDSLLVSTRAGRRDARALKNIIGIDQAFSSAMYQRQGDQDYWLFHFNENEYDEAEKTGIISKVIEVPAPAISVVKSHVSRMPAPETRHMGLLKDIDDHISNKPIFISSNYMQGLALEDCCQRAKKEAARLKLMMQDRRPSSRPAY